jgi:hypothetical protein
MKSNRGDQPDPDIETQTLVCSLSFSPLTNTRTSTDFTAKFRSGIFYVEVLKRIYIAITKSYSLSSIRCCSL